MDTESQVYRELQKYLNRLPDGFPPAESGVDVKVLQHFFTPEEAGIALQLSMKPEPLKRIYSRVKKSGMSIEELQRHLDDMIRKGTVVPNEEGYKEKHYSNASFGMGGIMSVQVERLTILRHPSPETPVFF
jgi:electron transport complex protein RnfB